MTDPANGPTPAVARGPVFGSSTRRFAAVFTGATVLAQIGQLLWLTTGSRAMSHSAFGTVLAAQALYGVLQFVVDSGATYYGARLAARAALDDDTRSSIIRVRLQLAAFAAVMTLGIGAAGGSRSLIANAPYVIALALWAIFNYWEAFGLGNGKPLSSYLVLRSAAPAIATFPFLVLGADSPVYVAGLAECGVLAIVSYAVGLRAKGALRSALRARRGPWRSIMTIGTPSIAWQVGLASGTVTLTVVGAPVSAAFLGVAVRLLTGINQLSAILATSLFPEFARKAHALQDDESVPTRAIDLAIRVVVLLTSGALAVFLMGESFFVDLFLPHAGRPAESTATLALAVAGASGVSLLVGFLLVARHRESVAAGAFVIGTVITLVAGIAVAAIKPRNESLWMAAALALGQFVALLLISRWTTELIPALRRSLYIGTSAAAGVLGGGIVAIAAPQTRYFVAAGAAALGVSLFISGSGQRGRSPGAPVGDPTNH